MEIVIKGEAKEIAALTLEMQGRQGVIQESTDVQSDGGRYHTAALSPETGKFERM